MSIPLTVKDMMKGGVMEQLHAALQGALQNIVDPNTPAKKARKVKLEITIKPDEARAFGDVSAATSTTLCAPQPLETHIYIASDRAGVAHASECADGENPLQHQLPGTGITGKVLSMPKKEGTSNA
jgi:hypothetical protein